MVTTTTSEKSKLQKTGRQYTHFFAFVQFKLEMYFRRLNNKLSTPVFIQVCPEEKGQPGDLKDDDGQGFTTTDNDDGDGPSSETDDDVPVFNDEATTVTQNPDTQGEQPTPYIITIKTPTSDIVYPMELVTKTVGNVKKIIIIVDDSPENEVSTLNSIFKY